MATHYSLHPVECHGAMISMVEYNDADRTSFMVTQGDITETRDDEDSAIECARILCAITGEDVHVSREDTWDGDEHYEESHVAGFWFDADTGQVNKY